MKNSNKVYWTQKNGVEIDIDAMDIQHLRNTLKMIVRNTKRKIEEVQEELERNNQNRNKELCSIGKRLQDEAISQMGPDDDFPYFTVGKGW